MLIENLKTAGVNGGEVGQLAFKALVRVGPEAVPALTAALELRPIDSSALISGLSRHCRESAAIMRVFVVHGPRARAAVPKLIELLGDTVCVEKGKYTAYPLREGAARALVSIGQDAVPALEEMKAKGSEELRSTANSLLIEIAARQSSR